MTGHARCNATSQVVIDGQEHQTVHCSKPATHDTNTHQGIVLDSDDNPIITHWTNQP